ncbi:unnamed protein product [Didymodactylos carnosus]|uniref:Uncharacterized protein n=1 Tax=Didymodactylos carnosus TaxID=1234261 RepID=A0A8S2DMS5_9BILA|nr:unnamed protein product [Didymodactylos carnosus]CAF3732480.1 unnamed protein product [Didymodactylos carnosus]
MPYHYRFRPLPAGLGGWLMTQSAESKVLVSGGWGLSSSLASGEINDPSTGQWNTSSSMARAREIHIVTPVLKVAQIISKNLRKEYVTVEEIRDNW